MKKVTLKQSDAARDYLKHFETALKNLQGSEIANGFQGHCEALPVEGVFSNEELDPYKKRWAVSQDIALSFAR